MQPPRSTLACLEKHTLLRVTCLGCAIIVGWLSAALLTGFPDPAPETGTTPTAKSSAPKITLDDATIKPPPAPSTSDEATSPKDAWLNTLTGLEFTSFDQAEPQILQAMQSKERDVRLRAVNLLIMSKDNAAILPLLALAQRDADADVRRNAIVALENSGLKANLTPYLINGAADGNEDVRSALVETVWSLSPEQRDEFIGQALSSSREDVSSTAFEILKHEPSTKTVKLLLNVYATNNAAQIKNANDVMSTLLSQTFANAREASTWWQQHGGEYQDDLSLNTTGSGANP